MKTIILFITLACVGLTDANAQSRQVPADSAHSLMGTYQLWGIALPEYFKWNESDSTFEYKSKKITNSDALEKINAFSKKMAYCDSIKKKKSDGYCRYSHQKSFVRSFFVSKKDISDIDNLMKKQRPATPYNGYRFHLGLQPYSLDRDSLTHSHLYLAPANYVNGSFVDYNIFKINGDNAQQIYYDLTLPCPNGCGSSQVQINDIQIPPCNGSVGSGDTTKELLFFDPQN